MKKKQYVKHDGNHIYKKQPLGRKKCKICGYVQRNYKN